ncbi:MAG: addiction module antidote protein, HigA family [Odoribacteraceae bacterium]|jgi:plasmid maintenance system antidote protein VapI|nr:addiction module antidote protein, HigA family [Odoribacteraceae bacterium]
MITLPGVDPMMIANNLEPYEPTHPGWLLKIEIEHRRISRHKLADMIGVDYKTVHERRRVDAEFVVLAAAALDVSANLFIALQTDYDTLTAKRNNEIIARVAKIKEANARVNKNTAMTRFDNTPAGLPVPAVM